MGAIPLYQVDPESLPVAIPLYLEKEESLEVQPLFPEATETLLEVMKELPVERLQPPPRLRNIRLRCTPARIPSQRQAKSRKKSLLRLIPGHWSKQETQQ